MNTHEQVSTLTTAFNPRREPALILMGVIAPLVTVIVGLLPIDLSVATTLNALAVAVAGVGTAWLVRSDQLAPALLGLGQALLIVALALGLDLSAAGQSAVLVIVGLVVAAFVRGAVVAPVAAVLVTPALPAAAATVVVPGQRADPSPS